MTAERKPTNFDELYPGRFLKAGELRGQKVTLTIKNVDTEMLEGDTGPKLKAILSFAESEKQMVACKTNGLCVKGMFGAKLADWIGKRITLVEGNWNGEPCVRIWGSPDIEKDFELPIVLPRRKPLAMTMHKVAPRKRESGED